MRLGFAVTRGVGGLEDTPLAELAQLGFGSVFIGCYEDEMRWDVERVATFARAVRAQGLPLYIVPWGYGRVFDPDPGISSLYVHVHPQTLQMNNRGRRCRKACPNDPRFLEWFASSMRTLAWLVESRGFLWDEPAMHYARGEWGCRCQYCRRLFRAAYAKEMPTTLTDEVVAFRENTLCMFMLAATAAIQGVDQRLQSHVMPTPLGARDRIYTGACDWGKLASRTTVDGISVLLGWSGTDTEMQAAIAEACEAGKSACTPQNKLLTLWVTGAPRDGYQVIETMRAAAGGGVAQLVIADYDLALQRVAVAGLIREFRQLAQRLSQRQ